MSTEVLVGLIGIGGVVIGILLQHFIQNYLELKKKKIEVLSNLIGEFNQLREVAMEKDKFTCMIELDRNLFYKKLKKARNSNLSSWFENLARLDERVFDTRTGIHKSAALLKAAYGSDLTDLYENIREHLKIDSFDYSVFDKMSPTELNDYYKSSAERRKEFIAKHSKVYFDSIGSIINRLNGLLSSLLN